MIRVVTILALVCLSVALIGPEAQAARWKLHATHTDHNFKVWGTVDCQAIGDPICSGTAVACRTYSGWAPSWCNDIIVRGYSGWCLANIVWKKVAVPQYDDDLGEWALEPLANYIETNAIDAMLPTISDSTTEFPELYYMMDLAQWLADPRPYQDEYEIVDGECPDLPGYLIGTTPITFNPDAPPSGYPFDTTPLTGTLWLDGEFGFDPTEQVGANPDAHLAMHVIVSDAYLGCEDVCPYSCEDIDNDVLPAEIVGAGFCTVAFLAYGFSGMTAVEYRVEGFPTGGGAPPLPLVEYCPASSMVSGDPFGDGCMQVLGETIEPDIPWQGTFCFAYARLNTYDLMPWWPVTLSYSPSAYTYPADPHNFVTGPPPDFEESPVLGEHGMTIGGPHSEETPYLSCSGPSASELETWGGIKERYR